MKTQISLRKENNEIVVVVPFNEDFIKSAKNLQGKWNSEKNAWIFDENLEEHVKNLLIKVYGVTGEDAYETCTLVIKNYTTRVSRNNVSLFSRTIVRENGYEKCYLGDDIIFIEGKYHANRFRNNVTINVKDATFEIQNFPVARTEFEDVQQAIKEGWVEIKVTENKRSKEEIEKEIATLKEKLAKLEEELNNL
jgi:hypothetical protein